MDSSGALNMLWYFLAYALLAILPVTVWLVEKTIRRAAAATTFQRIADRYSGTFHSNGRMRYPDVTFQYRGVPVYVQSTPSRYEKGERILTVSTAWPDNQFRFRLTPEQFASPLKSFVGIRNVTVGFPEFDSNFVIQTNDEQELSSRLSKPAQQVMTTMLTMGSRHEFDLQIVAGKLVWRKKADLRHGAFVEELIENFLRLYDSLNDDILPPVIDPTRKIPDFVWLPNVEPILYETDSSSPPQLPVCMVCGDEIVQQRVDCRSCRTAHHRECWIYIGMCSTYACGQKKYRKVK